MSTATLAQNVAEIDVQFQRFILRGRAYAERRGYTIAGSGGKFKVVNNRTWNSVKSRLESPQGIIFTYFTYQLLQAHDFWHLFREDGCRI
ncbi:tyrosyl-tRNA synthetase [Podila minutissima]|uniref:Tyrosyl-tRNA synthetase n=1 Tax=Podila minutissima TaxID=64525 RepID=A0A9P5SU84_9FUNG|nr:tyrosyl-tRNA synthetase [Podila minutissima]